MHEQQGSPAREKSMQEAQSGKKKAQKQSPQSLKQLQMPFVHSLFKTSRNETVQIDSACV